MKRYAAFLRGVSLMNAKMPDLKNAFEEAGFSDVKTILSSGNVIFSAPSASEGALERKAEAAMKAPRPRIPHDRASRRYASEHARFGPLQVLSAEARLEARRYVPARETEGGARFAHRA
jgi:hypothetical protein